MLFAILFLMFYECMLVLKLKGGYVLSRPYQRLPQLKTIVHNNLSRQFSRSIHNPLIPEPEYHCFVVAHITIPIWEQLSEFIEY